MPSNINKLIYQNLADKLKDINSAVFYNYHHLTVAEMNELRNRLYDAGADLSVIKNNIIKIAFDELGMNGLKEYASGPLSMIVAEDAISAIKVLVDFKKEFKKGDVRFSYVEGTALDKDDTETLAKLPSREELLSRIAGMIKGPGSRVSAAIKGPAGRVAGAVESRADEGREEENDAA